MYYIYINIIYIMLHIDTIYIYYIYHIHYNV